MIVKIQNRRGQYVDFDPSKLLPGEFAIVQTGDPNTADGKAIYIGVTAGNVKQLATLDELQSEVETALQSAIPEVVEEATQEAQDAADRAEAAAQTLEIDTTLTETGQAAEAKATGDAIDKLNERMDNFQPLSEEAKTALLNCFQHVMWKDDGNWYQNLYDALNAGQSKLTVQYVPGDYMAFVGDRLSDLKYKMIVTYDGQIVEPSNYELSGTLVEGNSTLAVSYNNEIANVIIPTLLAKNVLQFTNNDIFKFNGGGYGYDPQGVISVPYLKSAANERCFYSQVGRYPYRDTSNNVMTGIYPIPVPPDATTVTIVLTPSNLRISCSHWEYNASSNKYSWKAETSWHTGTITHSMPISSSKPRALNMIINAPGSGSPAFTDNTEPTQCVITFS